MREGGVCGKRWESEKLVGEKKGCRGVEWSAYKEMKDERGNIINK